MMALVSGLMSKLGLKVIFVAIAVGAFGILVFQYNSALKATAVLKHQNALLVQNIENKEKEIVLIKQQNTIQQEALEEREASLAALESQFIDLAENLGDDADQQAPASIKEAVRRLKELVENE